MNSNQSVSATFSQPAGTGDLEIEITGLPAGVKGNAGITGPDSYYKVVTESQTLTGLAVGTYTVEMGNATANETTYTATPVTQEKTLPGTNAKATLTYSNYDPLAVVLSESDCGGVDIGTSCTLTIELVNNTRSWGGTGGAIRGVEHFEFVSYDAGPVLQGRCNLSMSQSTGPGGNIGWATTCGVGSFSGNGALAVVTLKRISEGLTRFETSDPNFVPVTGSGEEGETGENGVLFVD